jgi:hypothetical protein
MNNHNNKKSVTYLDELEDLDDAYNRPILEPSKEQLNSKVRHFKLPDHESGMHIRSQNDYNQNFNNYPNNHHKIEDAIQMNRIVSNEEYNRNTRDEIANHNHIISNLHDISCIQISEHVKKCPICSRIYKNDNILYIVVIIVLLILCLLLSNKLFNLLCNK